MKTIFMILPLALILGFMVGCQDKEAMAELEAFKAQAAVEEQNKEIAKRYFEAFDNQDVDSLSTLVATDGVCYMPMLPKGFRLKNFIPAMKPHREAFPDSTHDIKSIIAEGDMVAVRVTEVSTHEGEYDGIPPTGKKIEVWLLESTLWKMMQLGMELTPKKD